MYSNNYSTMLDIRFDYGRCRETLLGRLAESAPSRIQLLTGPRQVGKTTLLLELAEFLGAGALYAAGDSPEAALPGHWERLWAEVEAAASHLGKVAVFLDEVHHFPNWASRLKAQWDRLRRARAPVHVVATGSSALRVSGESRESLAGRFERLTLSHWSAAALAGEFGLKRDEAAISVVRMGSYPGAFGLREDFHRWAAYIRNAIVEPAIGKDILALADVRKPGLLRQVFAVCAASPAQIVSLQKIQGQLQDAGALETIAHYLRLLEEAYLVAPLEKYAARPMRQRAGPPKLVTLNNALLAAISPSGIPDPERDPGRFGAWVENACLAFAWNSGQRVMYWREEPFELDGVAEGDWGAWAIEVKTGSFSAGDVRGLLEFTGRHPKYRPLIVCDAGKEDRGKRLGALAISWKEFLLAGPPSNSAR